MHELFDTPSYVAAVALMTGRLSTRVGFMKENKNQGTNGPVIAHLISGRPIISTEIQNLDKNG